MRHILGVKIFDALYFGQILAAIEPTKTARGSYVGKRSIEDHRLDLFFLRIPLRGVRSHVKVISSFGLGSGKTVFECKRSCAFVKLGISLITGIEFEFKLAYLNIVFIPNTCDFPFEIFIRCRALACEVVRSTVHILELRVVAYLLDECPSAIFAFVVAIELP